MQDRSPNRRDRWSHNDNRRRPAEAIVSRGGEIDSLLDAALPKFCGPLQMTAAFGREILHKQLLGPASSSSAGFSDILHVKHLQSMSLHHRALYIEACAEDSNDGRMSEFSGQMLLQCV